MSGCNETAQVIYHPAYLPCVIVHFISGISGLCLNGLIITIIYKVQVLCTNVKLLLFNISVAAVLICLWDSFKSFWHFLAWIQFNDHCKLKVEIYFKNTRWTQKTVYKKTLVGFDFLFHFGMVRHF